MDYTHYNGILYFYKWLGAWFTCWSDKLIGNYASYSMEIKIAIGVIMGAVIAIVFLLFLMLRKAYLEWRMRRIVRRMEHQYGDTIERIIRDDQDLTKEEVGNLLKL